MSTPLVVNAAVALWCALLWAALASFAGVAGERLPRGESLNGRSHCACGRLLRAGENIPILGWLRARGRTRCCAQRLPARYLIAESVSAAVGAAIGWWAGTWMPTSMGVAGAIVAGAAVLTLAVGIGASLRRPTT